MRSAQGSRSDSLSAQRCCGAGRLRSPDAKEGVDVRCDEQRAFVGAGSDAAARKGGELQRLDGGRQAKDDAHLRDRRGLGLRFPVGRCAAPTGGWRRREGRACIAAAAGMRGHRLG